MSKEITYSLKLKRQTLLKFILQIIGSGIFIIIGSVFFVSYYMFYIMGLTAVLETFIVYFLFKSQKDSIVINEESITVRKRSFYYREYNILAREYKDQIIDILGQKENKKNKEIIIRLNGLELDSNELLMSIRSYVDVNIEKF